MSHALDKGNSGAHPVGVLRAVFVHGQRQELVCLIWADDRVSTYVRRYVAGSPAQVGLKESAGGQPHSDENIVPLLKPEGTGLRDEGRVVCLCHRRCRQGNSHGDHGAADLSYKPSHPVSPHSVLQQAAPAMRAAIAAHPPQRVLDVQFGHRYMNANCVTAADTNVAS